MEDESNAPGMGAKHLSIELRENILQTQRECTLTWNTLDGNCAGTIVTFLWHKESLWMSCPSDIPRVAAIRRNPNVCVVVSVLGTGFGRDRCISIRGQCVIHDDTEAVRDEVIPMFVQKLGYKSDPKNVIDGMVETPGSVWLEVKPDRLFTSDYNDIMTESLGITTPEPAIM